MKALPVIKATAPPVPQFCIRVNSGGYLDFNNPKPEQFTFADITRGLCREHRFCGQTTMPFTVAMHLLNCLDVAKRDGVDIDTMKAVLMHDASEAFLRDIPKPLKVLLPDYQYIEERISSVIYEKYGINMTDPAILKYVRDVDHEMLINEKKALFAPDKYTWPDEHEVRQHSINLYEWNEDPFVLAYHLAVEANGLGINTDL